MDPYLENPGVFPGIHGRMIIYMADALASQIQPRYAASVGERIYVESSAGQRAIIPDVWMRRIENVSRSSISVVEPDFPVKLRVTDLEVSERFIEIIDLQSSLSVVTVIELVSPADQAWADTLIASKLVRPQTPPDR